MELFSHIHPPLFHLSNAVSFNLETQQKPLDENERG